MPSRLSIFIGFILIYMSVLVLNLRADCDGIKTLDTTS
jgi:hypothetical protein